MIVRTPGEIDNHNINTLIELQGRCPAQRTDAVAEMQATAFHVALKRHG
jgi:hypothetical protein